MAPWSIVMVVGSLGLAVFWAPLEVGAQLVVAAAPLGEAAAPLEVAAAAFLEVVAFACSRAGLSVAPGLLQVVRHW